MPYSNVPDELKALPQWAITVGDNKAPQTWDSVKNCHYAASVTNPDTWLNFNDAVALAQHVNATTAQETHIGFIFQDEGLVCIDFDNKQSLPERELEFKELIKRAQSYTEISKSGTGYHTIVKATMIDDGRRYNEKGLEVYKHNRFIIITGNAINCQRQINENQGLVDKIIALMPTKQSLQKTIPSKPQLKTDAEILHYLTTSRNSAKYNALMEGNWEPYYPGKTHSEATLGLCQIIAFYTQNFEQVERIYKLSNLYAYDQKKHNANWIAKTITQALWNREEELKVTTGIDLDGFLKDLVIPPKVNKLPINKLIPDTEHSLTNLPYGIGLLQRHIFSTMVFPDMEIAGLTALSIYKAYAAPSKLIDSQEGLGFNENVVVLAPTTFGKESIIKAFNRLLDQPGHLKPNFDLQRALPASQQGLHRHLEYNNSLMFVVDEIGEYIESSHQNYCKQESMGYLMECYTKALGWVCPPQTKEKSYTPIQNPRIGMLGFSTIERALEAFTSSHANSGTYNRYIIHVCDQLPKKKYLRGQNSYTVPKQCLEDLDFILDVTQPNWIEFSDASWEKYMEIDDTIIMPLKAEDNCFAGRLSEQAIKDAAILALSDHRFIMTEGDMELAYSIRLNSYYKFRECLLQSGGLNDSSLSSKVLQQLRHCFTEGKGKEKMIYISQLGNWCASYKKLDVNMQRTVVNALINEGTCKLDGIKIGAVD